VPTNCQLKRCVLIILVPCRQVDLSGVLLQVGSLFLYISAMHVGFVQLQCVCAHNLSGELYFHLWLPWCERGAFTFSLHVYANSLCAKHKLKLPTMSLWPLNFCQLQKWGKKIIKLSKKAYSWKMFACDGTGQLSAWYNGIVTASNAFTV